MKSNKTLIFYSGYYKSSFEFNEIVYLSSIFYKVIVVTVYDFKLEFPFNVEIYKLDMKGYHTWKFLTFRKSIITTGVLFQDICFRKFNLKYLSKTKERASLFLRNYYLSEVLDSFLLNKISYENTVFYTFWMNDGASVFSLFAKQKKIPYFYGRAHGRDLYDHRESYTHLIPFRKFQFKYSKKIFTVSEEGAVYLKQSYPQFSDKIQCIYLGSDNFGLSHLQADAVFTILSCAYIVDLKRLTLIADILMEIPFNIRWIHLGSDNHGLLNNSAKDMLFKKMEELKKYKNVVVDFKGDVSSQELTKIYLENSINLFISVSETEGLPVSMMEAISAGIPIMSTDVGGCSEIVTNNTGFLISKDFEIEKVAQIICNFKNSNKNTVEYRRGVRLFWEKNFNAKKNYELLVNNF